MQPLTTSLAAFIAVAAMLALLAAACWDFFIRV